MTVAERVRALVEPIVVDRGFALYDVERHGPVLRVTVSSANGDAPSLDEITEISRAVSRAVDEDDPIDGRYTLEVSTPGLERPLRTPEHFRGAVGETVLVTGRRAGEAARRHRGELLSADDDGVVVALQEHDGAEPEVERLALAYDEIEKARTLFEWGPTSKPGRGSSTSPARDRRTRS